ncbi:ketose-bisphosphate aldolase [Naematelia encephala]|uniref:Fructose-bisphosphate aldolase n=1 Tax=Naematelia encephala TaxID=71784 RepID=A0A1Y2B946_9TREE|nr:ketose-bisphosphate aldolase [Naematelia encephala]
MSLEGNRTLEILSKAEKEGYGILAQACYDWGSVIGLVRAAERAKSPAILQLFPITLEYGGGEFLQFCLDKAHNASVPIAVHLDHATSAEHLELAIGLAEKRGIKFDSIMVDASHADTEDENIAIAVPYIKRCVAQGIATEVELGRLEGGEAGVRVITGEMLTDPDKAERFMRETGAHILAPCIGNRHGTYVSKPDLRWDILQDLHSRFKGRVTLCAHGTDFYSPKGVDWDIYGGEAYFRETIKNGSIKINVNSWVRDPYAEALSKNLASQPFPDAMEAATENFAANCEKFMKLFGSAGKA